MAINLRPPRNYLLSSSPPPHILLKQFLYAITCIFSLVSIILFSIAIPKWNANFFHNKGPLRGDWTDGIVLGPLSFALLTNLIVLTFTRFVKQRRTIIQPKPSMALATLILLALTPCLALSAQGSLFRHWRAPAQRTQNGVLVCNLLNIFSRDCEPILYSIGELQLAGLVGGGLVWLAQFSIFLLGAYELRLQKLEEPEYGTGRRKGMPRILLLGNADLEKGHLFDRTESRERSSKSGRRRHHHHHHHHHQHGSSDQSHSDSSHTSRRHRHHHYGHRHRTSRHDNLSRNNVSHHTDMNIHPYSNPNPDSNVTSSSIYSQPGSAPPYQTHDPSYPSRTAVPIYLQEPELSHPPMINRNFI